jgi:aspartate racemase
MRTLGLIGGMSWESTAVCYRLINQQVARRLGGLHSAPLLLHVADAAGAALQAAGADAVILGCTEIGMRIDARCSPLPVFDTTELHAAAAVQWMLEPA